MNFNTKLETEQHQYAESIKDLQIKQTQGKGEQAFFPDIIRFSSFFVVVLNGDLVAQ